MPEDNSSLATNSREERDKFTAEATKALAEAKKAEVETRHIEAQARAEEARAEERQISLARERYKRNVELAADQYHYVYRFNGEVVPTSVKLCMKELATWRRLEPGCDIEIVFCSPGGSVVDGLALFDFIQQTRRAGHRVTTSSIGYAASMAGILLQAGDVRVMSHESWLLIHEASFGVVGSFGEVEDRVKWIEQIQERILDIFAARSNMTKAQIKRRWHRKDWWLDSNTALQHGFVDEIR